MADGDKDKDKPSIVIVCGAHHIPYHYRFLEAALKEAAYDNIRIVQLASTSPVVVDDSMQKDVDVIRTAIQEGINEEREVVVVLHSWSGSVGCAALEGLEGRVKHVVFLASWIQPSGRGASEWLGVEELGIYDIKDGLNHILSPIQTFYNDLPSPLAHDSTQYLLPMNNAVTKIPLTYPPIWNDIPCTYVICEEDEAIPSGLAEMMLRESKVRARVVRIGGGHSPFLGMPGRVVGILRAVGGESGWELRELEGVRVDGEGVGTEGVE